MHTKKIKYLYSTLAQFGQALNSAGLLWGVGASTLLHQYGLVECPSDIDILVAEKDVETADAILSNLGKRQQRSKTDIYATERFIEYSLPEIDVDLMAGYKIVLPNGIFDYPFDKQSVPISFNINQIEIPFTTLEDWYVLYQLMPGREAKVKIIEKYFKTKGIQHPELLKRMLQQDFIPESVVFRTEELIK